MIYIVCFGISALAAYCASRTPKRNVFLALSFASILLPTLLAGLRGMSIGVDTDSYYTMERFWGSASQAGSLMEYLSYYRNLGYGEMGFAFFLGSVAQLTGNFSVFLFLSHAFIITFIYIGAFRQRRHVEPALVLLLFYLLFYNFSLNGIRQFMAMSVVFAALADVEQKKHLRYALAVGAAMLFHNTAVLGLGALLLYWAMYWDCSRVIPSLNPTMRQRKIFVLGGLSCLVIVFPLVARILVALGLLLEKYNFFLTHADRIQPAIMISLYICLELGLVWLLNKSLRKRWEFFDYYWMLSACYLILLQLSNNIGHGRRIAMHYSMSNIITIAMLPNAFKHKKMRIVATWLVIGVALFYWWYSYVLRNASQTYPYVFIFNS